MDITVTIPDQAEEILESWLGKRQIQPWLQHAINDKLRRRLDATILEYTNLNPQKMTEEEKYKEINKFDLETREKRDIPL